MKITRAHDPNDYQVGLRHNLAMINVLTPDGKIAPIIERFLQIFAAVFFVSEQFPEQLRPWLLWSPLAHGMQLLRSAYFQAYESHDASLGYFLTSLVFMMVIALVAERLARPNVQPM